MVLLETEVEVESQLGTSSTEDRLCSVCTEPIPLSRLKAMPNTSQCVSCTEALGDVDLIKRYDDYIGRQGDEVVSTYFKGPNQYLDLAIKKLLNNDCFLPSDDDDYVDRNDNNKYVKSLKAKYLGPSFGFDRNCPTPVVIGD